MSVMKAIPFEVISALLSRSQVYILKSLEKSHLDDLLQKSIKKDPFLSKKDIKLTETESLMQISGGDARKLLNALEIVVNSLEGKKIDILKENNIVWGQAMIDKGYIQGKCDHLYATVQFRGKIVFVEDF